MAKGNLEDSEGREKSWWLRHLGLIAGLIATAFVLGLLANHFHMRSPFGPGSAAIKPRPRPAEFLYLDNERVAAYLAQLDGGVATSERLSETLTEEASEKVSAGDFEVGASAQHQNFVQREITPTASANFFRLFTALHEQGELKDVSASNLDDFMPLDEGSFVRFTSADIRTPIYANPYLVVRQAGTLSALLPAKGSSAELGREAMQEREFARGFAHQVGPNPRIVFALTPRASRDGSGADESIKFLLPMHYRQLTDERSLIKDGGGEFTVVGKLVRMFRAKKKPGASPSYIDSPTLETWAKPLKRAPRPLVRRASRKCHLQKKNLGPRECDLVRLKQQTKIPDQGAVILPVAIYK